MSGKSEKEVKTEDPKKVEGDLQIIEEDMFEDFPVDAGNRSLNRLYPS